MASWSFSAHPASVGETYGEHRRAAWGFAGRLALGALACLVHGVFPFLCTKTGSTIIRDLHQRIASRDPAIRLGQEPGARLSPSAAVGSLPRSWREFPRR